MDLGFDRRTQAEPVIPHGIPLYDLDLWMALHCRRCGVSVLWWERATSQTAQQAVIKRFQTEHALCERKE